MARATREKPWGRCRALSLLFSLCHEKGMTRIQAAASPGVPLRRAPWHTAAAGSESGGHVSEKQTRVTGSY